MMGAVRPHRGGARSRRRCDGVGGAVGVHQLRWEPTGGIPEPVPLVEIDVADLRVVDEQPVVELGAQPGRVELVGPVQVARGTPPASVRTRNLLCPGSGLLGFAFLSRSTSSLPKPKGESEPAWPWIFMGFLGALSLCVTGTFALIIFVATANRIRRRICSRDRRLTDTPAALGLENRP